MSMPGGWEQVVDFDPPNPKPHGQPRECCVCESQDRHLTRPCRDCLSDYCPQCLIDMFSFAVTGKTGMPPKCHSLVQIHTVSAYIPHGQIITYREKFLEFLRLGFYCPSPECSVFIPETVIPNNQKISLSMLLQGVMDELMKLDSAAIFAEKSPEALVPGNYYEIVRHFINLDTIREKIQDQKYANWAAIDRDMMLIVTNTRDFWGDDHELTRDAIELFTVYLKHRNAAPEVSSHQSTGEQNLSFSCSNCQVEICSDCQQIDHPGEACKPTASDNGPGENLGDNIKACPLCHAYCVKSKGCVHVQCHCGAMFCWNCLRDINDCVGECDSSGSEEGRDVRTTSSDENDSTREPRAVTGDRTGTAATESQGDSSSGVKAQGDSLTAKFDFAPNVDFSPQIWSCKHQFDLYPMPPSIPKYDYGATLQMECNRCALHLMPEQDLSIRTAKLARLALRLGVNLPSDDLSPVVLDWQAWECRLCRLVLCRGCKSKIPSTKALETSESSESMDG